MPQIQKQKKRRDDAPAPAVMPTVKKTELPDDTLLDEIDELLSVMGQDFATNYVQKGGQ